jgi:two-component system sensor histidine kinase DesK
MLLEDRLAIRAALSTAMLWALAPEPTRTMTGRPVLVDRAEREPRTPELAPTLTRDVVRVFAASAIGVNIALSLIDVWRLLYVVPQVPPSAVRAAIIAAAFAIPVHTRHVIYGLRGERPPAGAWTLALLAMINAVAVVNVGSAWIFQFASLAVSTLLIVPGVWGVAIVCAIVAAPLALVGTQWYGGPVPYGGFYLAFAITWRSATQFIPLRLLAAMRALDAAGRELEARAVVQARVRIDGELRTGVTTALQQIVTRGDSARAIAATDSAAATAELRGLVNDSRRALTQARRVVSGYRRSSVRAELDAAAALLEASGASVRVVAADGVALDAPDENARRAIRAALAQALRDEPNVNYLVEVGRDRDGALTVGVSADHRTDAADTEVRGP